MEHVYTNVSFGENWFNYPSVYKMIVEQAKDNSKFVEIGSWKGRSAAYMLVEIINSKKNIQLTSVDSWPAEEIYQIYRGNMDGFLKNPNLYKHIRGSSVEGSEHFENNSLDFVFIDACHLYECITLDIDTWLPKVKKGGILAGHDYNLDDPTNPEHAGVIKAIDELFPKDRITIKDTCWIYQV
jgi:predicted O-methyltransferase YrrM